MSRFTEATWEANGETVRRSTDGSNLVRHHKEREQVVPRQL